MSYIFQVLRQRNKTKHEQVLSGPQAISQGHVDLSALEGSSSPDNHELCRGLSSGLLGPIRLIHSMSGEVGSHALSDLKWTVFITQWTAFAVSSVVRDNNAVEPSTV